MVQKPTSGDEEQRSAQTRASREQSGLPPEETSEERAEPTPQRQEGAAAARETTPRGNR